MKDALSHGDDFAKRRPPIESGVFRFRYPQNVARLGDHRRVGRPCGGANSEAEPSRGWVPRRANVDEMGVTPVSGSGAGSFFSPPFGAIHRLSLAGDLQLSLSFARGELPRKAGCQTSGNRNDCKVIK
jgi:hypothetical protein